MAPAVHAGAPHDGWCGTRAPALAMSPRPVVTIAHPADDPVRQLTGAFHAVLPRRPWAALHAAVPWVPGVDPARGTAASRVRLIRLVDAIRDELGLPSIVPIASDGAQLEVTSTLDPLVALGLLVRRSGPVWLADRIPAFEGLAAGSAVTLLLSPRLLADVVRRTTDPAWRPAVLARAQQPEVTA
jgi:hypothetical protein